MKDEKGQELVEIEGTTLHETPDAVLMCPGDAQSWPLFIPKNEKVWLPKSQLEDWPDVGTYGEFLIPEWLAVEKELV